VDVPVLKRNRGKSKDPMQLHLHVQTLSGCEDRLAPLSLPEAEGCEGWCPHPRERRDSQGAEAIKGHSPEKGKFPT